MVTFSHLSLQNPSGVTFLQIYQTDSKLIDIPPLKDFNRQFFSQGFKGFFESFDRSQMYHISWQHIHITMKTFLNSYFQNAFP